MPRRASAKSSDVSPQTPPRRRRRTARKKAAAEPDNSQIAALDSALPADTVVSDKDHIVRRKRRRSTKRNSAANASATPPDEIIKAPAAAGTDALPLMGADTSAIPEAITANEVIFHAPAVIGAPNRRCVLVLACVAATRWPLLIASAARQAAVRFLHWSGRGVRTAMQRARRLNARAAIAAASSYGRTLTELMFVATRAMAVILIGLAFYALILIAQTPPEAATDRRLSPTSSDIATIDTRAPATIPNLARPAPADGEPGDPSDASGKVRMIDAPAIKGQCGGQAWPYLPQHCLAVGQD